jgi:uncharacterized membrane protein YeaQ/YmgE (transglycosylase-associated protein family)
MLPIITMLIVGLIVGVLAKFLMPGRDPGGFVITIALGIAGSLLAGFLGRELGWYRHSEGAGWLASIAGAMLILFVYHLAIGRRGFRV